LWAENGNEEDKKKPTSSSMFPFQMSSPLLIPGTRRQKEHTLGDLSYQVFSPVCLLRQERGSERKNQMNIWLFFLALLQKRKRRKEFDLIPRNLS
jgi:hypothetical protein